MAKGQVDKTFLSELSDLLTVALENQTKFIREDNKEVKRNPAKPRASKDEQKHEKLLASVNEMVVDACNFRLSLCSNTTKLVKIKKEEIPPEELLKKEEKPKPVLKAEIGEVTKVRDKTKVAEKKEVPAKTVVIKKERQKRPAESPKDNTDTPDKTKQTQPVTVNFVRRKSQLHALLIIPSPKGEPALLTLRCVMCSKTLKDKSELFEHLSTIHKEGNVDYTCLICTKWFYSRGHLFEHIAVHTGVKPVACNQCDETFWRRANLEIHSLKVHKKVAKSN